MAFQKLLLNGGLIFIVIVSLTGAISKDDFLTKKYRLPDYIIPTHYNIKLESHLDKDNINIMSPLYEHVVLKQQRMKYDLFFSGEADVNIKILCPTHKISFHILNSQIDLFSIKLINSSDISHEHRWYQHVYDTQVVDISYNNKLPVGRYTLKMKFHSFSKVDNINGLFNVSYGENGQFKAFATRFHAIGARRMFPCWDEPQFRTTFNISILHDSKYTVLSNMPVRTRVDAGVGGMSWTHFETTFPIPTYLVAFTMNEFSRVYSDQRISVWSRPYVKEHVEFANIIAKQITALLKSEWKIMEKIQKVDLVAIPCYLDNGISNPGLILYREDSILYKNNFDSISHKMEVARLIGYKMAYQVFGDLVSPTWWSHLWFNEGLSLLIGINVIDKIDVHFQMMDLFIVQEQHESLHLNSFIATTPKSVESSSEINSLLSLPRHIKAFCLLRMLQHLLSDDVFRKGVQIYLKHKAFKTANPNNLWKAMQTALSRMDLEYKPNIKIVMNSWIQQKHYPEIKVMRNYDNGWVNVSMLNFNKPNKSWILLTYTTQSDFNFNNMSVFTNHLWLGSSAKKLKCSRYVEFFSKPQDDWIIVNLQQSGYYRVNYDDKNWLGIAAYLKTSNYMNIHVLNRAKVIDDAFYFLLAGKLNASVFWNLTSYLSQETDFIAWYPMFKVFEYMSTILPFSDERVEEIKAKMHEMLDGVLKKTGYDEKAIDNNKALTKRLMLEAAKWACIIRHRECMSMAAIKFDQFLSNPKKNRPLPWWYEWTCCNGLIARNVNWNKLTNKRVDNRLLGCSDKTAIIIEHLKLIAYKENSQDILISSFHSIVARHAKNNKVLTYMLRHFFKIKPRKHTIVAVLIDIINYVYSRKQLNEISKFVERHVNYLLIPDIQQKIDLRMSQINDQMNYIQIWNHK